MRLNRSASSSSSNAWKNRSLTEDRKVPLTDALLERLLDRRARMAEYELAGPDDFVFGRRTPR
jgi:hypothetical protein